MKKLFINYEISSYMEKLVFESNMAKRELDMAKKLQCEKQVVCRACKKAKVAMLKLATAKEEFSKIMKHHVPNMKNWHIDFEKQEVEYETN